MNDAVLRQTTAPLLLAIGVALSFVTVSPVDATTAKPGKYKGKTGSTGRISFKVDRKGRKMSNLFVSIFALGQDTYGNFTKYSTIASRTDGKRFRIRRSGSFKAAGVDRNGIRYKVEGKLKGGGKIRRKFKGTVEMSKFQLDRYEYNYITGFSEPVYELVSGSRGYTAKN